MKSIPIALLLTSFSLPVLASCDSIKEQISQKIINNGLPESAFSLTVEPADSQKTQSLGKVVGHCESNKNVIVYQKHEVNSVNSGNTPSVTH